MDKIFEKIKELYWNNKILKSDDKEKLFYSLKK